MNAYDRNTPITRLKLLDAAYYQVTFCSTIFGEQTLLEKVATTIEQKYYKEHRRIVLGLYSDDWRHAMLIYDAPTQLENWANVYSGTTINSILRYHRTDEQPYFSPHSDMRWYEESLFRECGYLVMEECSTMELMVGAKKGSLPHMLLLCYLATIMYHNTVYLEDLSYAWSLARNEVYRVSFRADYLMRTIMTPKKKGDPYYALLKEKVLTHS